MGELSIEDARREISGHLVEHIRNKTHPQARCCLAVADAYALAVHRDMVEIIKPLVVLAAGVDMKAVERANDLGVDLRKRIKALGKEG